MITALLSDVHGNRQALEACVEHALEQGADRFAFLGDLVGYGGSPESVVEMVSDLVDRGAIAVAGNHDVAISASDVHLHEDAREVIAWTRSRLSAAHRAFLASLPLMVREDDVCYVHSTAEAPSSWKYIEDIMGVCDSIDAAKTTYTFSGHVHDQVLYFRTLAGKTAPFRPLSGSPVPVPSHRRWLGLVGSVGQPRDRNPAAAYALFDSASEEMTFFRVPYDHLAAAADIRAARLPEWLAARIEHGT